MIQALVDERRDLAVRLAEVERLIALELVALHQVVHQDQTLLTARQVAKRLGLSTVFIYELARTKALKCTRAGRAVRFSPAAVDAYIKGKS